MDQIAIKSLKEAVAYRKNDWAELWVHDGLIYIYYSSEVVDLKCAYKILEDRLALCDGKAYATMTLCKNVKYWTKEAQKFQNTPQNYELYTAAAIIYSESYVTNILVNYYLKFTKVLIPARFFGDEADAYQWLQKYKRQD